jgi:hypothetical protein
MTEPNTGKSPRLRLLAWCDYIEALVGTPTLGRGKTPPLAAFRPNAAGRRAWLDQTGRELKRSEVRKPHDARARTTHHHQRGLTHG